MLVSDTMGTNERNVVGESRQLVVDSSLEESISVATTFECGSPIFAVVDSDIRPNKIFNAIESLLHRM